MRLSVTILVCNGYGYSQYYNDDGADMVKITWWRRPVPASSSQPQSWCEWRPCRRTADPVIELFISIWIRLLGSLSIRQTIVILYARFSDSNTTSFISLTSLPVLLVHIKAPVRSRLEEIFPESWICREGSAGWLGCWNNSHTHTHMHDLRVV